MYILNVSKRKTDASLILWPKMPSVAVEVHMNYSCLQITYFLYIYPHTDLGAK